MAWFKSLSRKKSALCNPIKCVKRNFRLPKQVIPAKAGISDRELGRLYVFLYDTNTFVPFFDRRLTASILASLKLASNSRLRGNDLLFEREGLLTPLRGLGLAGDASKALHCELSAGPKKRFGPTDKLI
jgi:hypothetical protein